MFSFRFLKRNKGYVVVNLIGLATGLTACLLMISFVKYQTAFDSFHLNKDRIFRGLSVIQMAGKENTTIHMPGLLGEEAMREVAGIECATRLHSSLRYEILCDEKKYIDQKLYYTDSTFFKVFSFHLTAGNPGDALNAPYSVVLTRHAARKFFGDTDPFGQTVKINDWPYRVTGLLEDLPENSHITFDLLASFSSIARPDDSIVNREGFAFPTYFLLRSGVSPESVMPQVNQVFDRVVQQRYGKAGITGDLFFQPLGSIHTTQLEATDYAKTTSRSTLILFTAMAIFILLVGVINFINLTTALYERRSREIGIKKVLGATRLQLFRQTLEETSMLVGAALLIALILCEILKGWAETRWAIELPLFYKTGVIWTILLSLGVALIALLSSIYPNWYLSRKNAGNILKEESMARSRKVSIAKLLVLVQYGLAVFIICLMFLFSAQLRFIAKADLGFEPKEVVVYENLTEQVMAGYSFIKSKILQFPAVASVTASYSIPGKNRISNSVVYKYGSSEASGTLINVNRVQQDYLETFGIQLAEGEDFSKLHLRDSGSFLINRQAARELGLDQPVGEEIVLRGVKGKVIGVFNNFRTKPLYSEFDKEILTMQTDRFNFISIRMKPGYGMEDLKNIEAVFTGVDPGYQTSSFFVGEMYRGFYKREENQVQLIFSAAIVGIILSIMGLVGLTVLSLKKQRKEIGIRKVFGASGSSVFILLINRMIKWVILSNLLAWPLAWLVAANWLSRFAYRIRIIEEWPSFLLAGGLVALLALLAIGIQSYGVSRMSPAEVIQKG